MQAVARTGTATSAGDTFASFPSPPQINAAGQIAFLATLPGPAVTTANDAALFAGTGGGVYKVVRTGDQIAVGVTTKTVSGIESRSFSTGDDGRGISLTDAGSRVYTLSFTDGSSGVFTSVVPVTEPALVGLTAAAGLVRRRGGFGWTPARVGA